MWRTSPFGSRFLTIALVLPLVTTIAWGSQSTSEAVVTKASPPSTSAPLAQKPDMESMESALRQAVSDHPQDFAAQRNLGEFYLRQNRLSDGIPHLQRALQLNRSDYNTGYDLSLAYLNLPDVPKASAQLHGMIAQRETAELDNLLAEADGKSGDYESAAVEYHRAAELDPSEENIFDLASFLLQHNNYQGFLDNSLAFFRYGIQRYPRSARLTVGLGVSLYAEGKYDESVQALCAAVDLDPADPKPFEFLGKVSNASAASMSEVRKRLEHFVRLYPGNGSALYYYAMSLRQHPNDAAAVAPKTIEELLKKAILADPELYEAHFQLGALYQDQEKYSEAIEEFNNTLRLRPDYNRAHYRLVVLYSRTHQKELADQHLAILKQIKKEDAQSEELGKNPEDIQAATNRQNSH